MSHGAQVHSLGMGGTQGCRTAQLRFSSCGFYFSNQATFPLPGVQRTSSTGASKVVQQRNFMFHMQYIYNMIYSALQSQVSQIAQCEAHVSNDALTAETLGKLCNGS